MVVVYGQKNRSIKIRSHRRPGRAQEKGLAGPRDRSPRPTESKRSFKSWQDGFLEAYIAHGMEPIENGALRLSCDPAWESRCFSVCPHDVWRYIPQIKCPTLVLYGKESDTFLTPAARRFKRKYPRAVLNGFPETSHFVPMERPEETQKAILEFLTESKIL